MAIDAWDIKVETDRGDVTVRVLPEQPLGVILAMVLAEYDVPVYNWPEYDLVTGPGETAGPQGLNKSIYSVLADGDRITLDVPLVGI